MSFKGLGDQITPEDQARKLEAASIIAAGSPAGSEISRGAQGTFFVCPRRRSTCENLECKVAVSLSRDARNRARWQWRAAST